MALRAKQSRSRWSILSRAPGSRDVRQPALGMPKGSPREAIERINAEVNRALSEAKILERLATLGSRPIKGTPEDSGRVNS